MDEARPRPEAGKPRPLLPRISIQDYRPDPEAIRLALHGPKHAGKDADARDHRRPVQ